MADPLIDWATAEATRLEEIAAKTKDSLATGTDEVLNARQFLNQYAGGTTHALSVASVSPYTSEACDKVAKALRNWVKYREDGLHDAETFEVRSRNVASEDLLDQVAALLKEKGVHPAAAAMLLGAALEEFLRGLVEKHGIKIPGKPGLAKYAAELKRAGVINTAVEREVQSIADCRNDAAHGKFDQIDLPRVRLMNQMVVHVQSVISGNT